MASARLRKLYRDARKHLGRCVSPSVPYCMRVARTLAQWSALESLGLVRISAEEDEDAANDPDSIACSCGDPKCIQGPERIRETIESIGVWGVVGEFGLPDRWAGEPTSIFVPDCLVWHHADAVWGHIGYRDCADWRENPYVIDIMDETIRQFRDAWKSRVREQADERAGRCPACHGTGRVNAPSVVP